MSSAGADLVERITGGAGPGGVKAVAPIGSEPISVEIPPDVTEVALLGEADRGGRRRRSRVFGAGASDRGHQQRDS